MTWQRRLQLLGAGVIGVMILQACAGPTMTGRDVLPGPPEQEQRIGEALRAYELGAGDNIRLTVYRHEDLSGEFRLDDQGRFPLPLVGEIEGAGQTARELERRVAERLQDGYLVDPQVSVEILTYQPVTVVGEVGSAGRYPYESGMTVIDAAAAAGGFTPRANTGRIVVNRGSGADGIAFYATPDMEILPGDLIEVPERFF